MAKTNKIVELLGTGDDEVIQPYFDVTLTGSLSGYDHIHADGHVVIDTRLSSDFELTGFTEGTGVFDSEGNVTVETTPGAWRQSMFGDWTTATAQNGKVINIFRKV